MAARSGAHPRRSHSSSHSAGVRWPLARLHRPHAATSFSIHDGPPLPAARRARWSPARAPGRWDAGTRRTPRPSRSRITTNRSPRDRSRSPRLPRYVAVRRDHRRRMADRTVRTQPDGRAAPRQPAHRPAGVAVRPVVGRRLPRPHGGPRPRHAEPRARGAPAGRPRRARARLGRRGGPPVRPVRPRTRPRSTRSTAAGLDVPLLLHPARDPRGRRGAPHGRAPKAPTRAPAAT